MKVLKLHLVSIDWCYCPRYFDRQMSMLESVKKVSLLFSMPYNNTKLFKLLTAVLSYKFGASKRSGRNSEKVPCKQGCKTM